MSKEDEGLSSKSKAAKGRWGEIPVLKAGFIVFKRFPTKNKDFFARRRLAIRHYCGYCEKSGKIC